MLAILTGGTNIKPAQLQNNLKRKREEVEQKSIHSDQDCKELRKQLRINVTGEKGGLCYPLTAFADKLDERVVANLQNYGYSHPSPVQMQSIPLQLDKRDLLVCAPTGSGKTLAFVLPIVARLKTHEAGGYRAVVVSPTRELATQIHKQFRKVTEKMSLKVNLLTKSNAVIQEKNPELASAYDILVTTPLRLIDHIKTDKISLANVEVLILDEADKLFEDGFVEQTDEILAACTNKNISKALFSATLPAGVEQLAKTVMKAPVRIIVGTKDTVTDLIEQKLTFVGTEGGKLIALRQLVKDGGLRPPVLIFVQSIERAKELHTEMIQDELNVDVIHSDRSQGERDEVTSKFREGKTWILIATELLSRGIDFQGVSLVINYDFPQSLQSYIHRIGRTGRAGHQGKAITFFSKDDIHYLKGVAHVIRSSGGEVADWMMDLKAATHNEKKTLKKKPLDRRAISSVTRQERAREAHKKDMIRGTKMKKRAKEALNAGKA